ncbi:hypothetical protein CU008_2330 [Enterococcus faecium]|nr:hypothetical protein [Enterococcus faecium]
MGCPMTQTVFTGVALFFQAHDQRHVVVFFKADNGFILAILHNDRLTVSMD